jgi:hypothetical protein
MGQWYSLETKSEHVARKIRLGLRGVRTVQGPKRQIYALVGDGESRWPWRRWLRRMEASLDVVVRVCVNPGPTAKTKCGIVMLDRIVWRGQKLIEFHERRCKACKTLPAVHWLSASSPESIPAEPTEPAKAADAVVPSPEIPGLGPSIQVLTQIQEQAFSLAAEAESTIAACQRALDAEARLKELQRRATAQHDALQALVADLVGRLGGKEE